MAYDIFISYRRDGGADIARQIQLVLENYGYKVFLDYDSANTDSFEKKIKSGIAEAPIFLFVLSNGSLGRCCNDGDWVRKEIEYAFELQKNIVPVNPDREFGDFPNDCPELVRKALGQHTFVEIFTGQQLKPTIETLVKQRIQPIVSPTKNGGDEVPVYIEVDMDCQIEVFDKPLCAVEAGVCKEIYMRAGMKKITAISAENPVDRIVIKPKILANEDNYIEIKLSSIKDEREKEDLERIHKVEEQKRKEEERIRIEEERKKEEARKLNNHNGHEYVDLGLPSGLKWATCNVGATKPEEYGDYFAWGETTTKCSYTSSNSETYGVSMGDISGNPNYDVARATWGGTWRLPTSEEFEELIQCCTWTWTTENRQKGYKVTSRRNGNSIFLPSAGYRLDSSLYDAGSGGHYWSSSPYGSSNTCLLRFNSSECKEAWLYRRYGCSVRAVSE